MIQITVDGIPVLVERKRIKNMYLRIRPDGTVHISAPQLMSEEAILTFVSSRTGWIKRHLQKHPPVSTQLSYTGGEMHPLWGKLYPLRLLPTERGCTVSFDGTHFLLYASANSSSAQRKTALDTFYRTQLRNAISTLQCECESVVGRQAAEYRIRDMSTRWGSCSIARRRVWLSLHLVKYPPDCLRYVMIHELTHLLVPDHSPRFQAYMDQFCPDWRSIRQKLNQPPQSH